MTTSPLAKPLHSIVPPLITPLLDRVRQVLVELKMLS